MKLFKSTDPWSRGVILLTIGLFSLSLAVKGFTHELFLEAGVFLVSVKLILMAGKNAASEERVERQLSQIKALLARDPAPNGQCEPPHPSNLPKKGKTIQLERITL
jgi:hypothetical protein